MRAVVTRIAVTLDEPFDVPDGSQVVDFTQTALDQGLLWIITPLPRAVSGGGSKGLTPLVDVAYPPPAASKGSPSGEGTPND